MDSLSLDIPLRDITLGPLIKNKIRIGSINRKVILSKKLYLFICE